MSDKIIHEWIDDSGEQWILMSIPTSYHPGIPALKRNDMLVRHGGSINHELARLADRVRLLEAVAEATEDQIREDTTDSMRRIYNIVKSLREAGYLNYE